MCGLIALHHQLLIGIGKHTVTYHDLFPGAIGLSLDLERHIPIQQLQIVKVAGSFAEH